ncbi:hypothetical protein [Methylobacterium sp. 77]|uniref:hypothetical protein n=1 Tax=Methylobacterium sp. 77 TaxID=1101192 RepID=UPI000564536B|nr:hypothetical protein [Methylobacterium sp. 77]
MLKLKPAATDLAWLDLLPGVRVRVRPISVAMVLIGRDEAGKVFLENRVASEADAEAGNPNVGTHAGIALVRSLAHAGIVEWEGVGDSDGAVIVVTPEHIDLLLDDWRAYDALDRHYVGPALDREREKNA